MTLHTLLGHLLDNRIAVIALVGNQVLAWKPSIRAAAWQQSAWVAAVTIALKGIPCASTAKCTFVLPPFSATNRLTASACSCAVLVHFAVRSTYHKSLKIRIIYKDLKQLLPDPPVALATKPAMRIRPTPVLRRKVTHRGPRAQKPDYPVNKTPIIMGYPTPIACTPRPTTPTTDPSNHDADNSFSSALYKQNDPKMKALTQSHDYTP